MHNVAPSRALVRRSRQLLQLAFLMVAAGTFFAVVGIAMYVLPLAPLADQSYRTISGIVFVGGVVIGLGGLAMAARAVTWKTDNDLARITGEFLGRSLDARYTFIRNISKLGLGYIDAVLVGPQGALVFRTLGNEGIFFNEASKWLRQKKKDDWVPLRFNPTRQVVDDVQHLRQCLGKHGLENIPVYGVIVFTKDQSLVQVSADKPTVPVALLQDVFDRLSDNYMAKERIDQRTADAIVKTLFTQ